LRAWKGNSGQESPGKTPGSRFPRERFSIEPALALGREPFDFFPLPRVSQATPLLQDFRLFFLPPYKPFMTLFLASLTFDIFL
jgi:hypothetical protein